jgi:two-component system nitrogen regulation sensor histidine kinase GlnL
MSSKNKKINLNLSEALTTAIVVLDTSLCIGYMNASAEVLFAQSYQQVAGKPYHHLFHMDLASNYLNHALKHTDSQTLRECVLKTPHEKVMVDCIATPYLPDGEQEGIIIELLRVDRKVRISRENRLWKEQEATQTLVRGLAHEIKNPLGGLRGAAQLLESELTDDELKEYTRIIIAEADRLQHLVNRMLGSPRRPNMESINIHEILEHVRKLVTPDLPKAVKLQFDYDPSIPHVTADKDQLIQIVLNITVNAIKAVANKGLILFRTRILRQFTLNHITYPLIMQLEVIDDGAGIAEELQEKVFFPMVSGSAEGSGLGLSIAQSLANKHKGLIEFDSRQGYTQFVLLLPIEEGKKDVTA